MDDDRIGSCLRVTLQKTLADTRAYRPSALGLGMSTLWSLAGREK